jgi:uncharacterized protein YbaA (DUF1428 family)
MNADQSLNVEIKMSLEGQENAIKAKEAISDLTGTQKGLTESTVVATERAREHTAAQREIFRIANELNQIMPGLGEAMRGVFDPESFGIVAALLAVEAFKSVMDDLAAIDKIQLANFTGDKAALDAVKDAYEKCAVAAALFNDEIIRQNTVGMSAEDISKRQIENYKNLEKAQDDYNTAAKRLGESQIDAAEKNGVISHAQALQEKFALDVEYTAKKMQLDAQADAATLASKQQQLKTEQTQLSSLLGDQKTDEANARSAEGVKAKHDKEGEAAKKNIDAAQKTLDELGQSHGTFVQGIVNDDTVQQLKEYHDKYVGGNSETTSLSKQFYDLMNAKDNITSAASWDPQLTYFLDRTIGQQTGGAELEKYQGAKNQIAGANKELDALSKTQFDVDLNAERGKKQLEATDDQISKLTKSIADLSNEIPNLKADAAAKQNNAAGVANLNLRADAIAKGLPDPGNIFQSSNAPVATTAQPFEASGTAAAPAAAPSPTSQQMAQKDVAQLEAAAKILGAGGTLDSQQTQLLEGILTAAEGHTVKADKILGVLQKLTGTVTAHDATLANLERQIDNFRSRQNQPWGQ